MFCTLTMTTGDTTVDLAYLYTWPPQLELPDDRHNPKMWAKWFQEFLDDLLGAGRAVIKEARQRHPLTAQIEEKCRSAPLFQSEWTMKLWKQRH
jgi:hypothetical protein